MAFCLRFIVLFTSKICLTLITFFLSINGGYQLPVGCVVVVGQAMLACGKPCVIWNELQWLCFTWMFTASSPLLPSIVPYHLQVSIYAFILITSVLIIHSAIRLIYLHHHNIIRVLQQQPLECRRMLITLSLEFHQHQSMFDISRIPGPTSSQHDSVYCIL